MTAIIAPDGDGLALLDGELLDHARLAAVISFSIFIASMMQTSWRSATSCPASTTSFQMLPWS
jgi:hypothetical protein